MQLQKESVEAVMGKELAVEEELQKGEELCAVELSIWS
jgi:hypothetical protein